MTVIKAIAAFGRDFTAFDHQTFIGADTVTSAAFTDFNLIGRSTPGAHNPAEDPNQAGVKAVAPIRRIAAKERDVPPDDRGTAGDIRTVA